MGYIMANGDKFSKCFNESDYGCSISRFGTGCTTTPLQPVSINFEAWGIGVQAASILSFRITEISKVCHLSHIGEMTYRIVHEAACCQSFCPGRILWELIYCCELYFII